VADPISVAAWVRGCLRGGCGQSAEPGGEVRTPRGDRVRPGRSRGDPGQVRGVVTAGQVAAASGMAGVIHEYRLVA